MAGELKALEVLAELASQGIIGRPWLGGYDKTKTGDLALYLSRSAVTGL